MGPDLLYKNYLLDHDEGITIYARRGTFNQATQHLYPTEKNGLSHDLEAPYAHSLSTGVRYWTKEDAGLDIRWNALAKPPCLNCLVSDDRSLARRCDRYLRQEATRGKSRCCWNCEQTGQAKSCVELIEVSVVHLFEPLTAANRPEVPRVMRTLHQRSRQHPGNRDVGIWGRTAHEQRSKRLVAWRPINLARGDVAGKMAIVEKHFANEKALSFGLKTVPFTAPKDKSMATKHRANGGNLPCALVPVSFTAPQDQHGAGFSLDSQLACAWRLRRAILVVRVWDEIDVQMAEALTEGALTDIDSVFDTSDAASQSTATSIDEEEQHSSRSLLEA